MATLLRNLTGKLLVPEPPNLPLAPMAYVQLHQNSHSNVLRLYFNRISGILNALLGKEGGIYLSTPYAVFTSSSTQTAAVINTAYPIYYDTTVISNDLSYPIANPSRVTANKPGIYNFQFSLQLDKTAGASGSIFIWPSVNGVAVPNSATKVTVQGTAAECVAAWNFFVPMISGDYFELYWSTDDIRCVLLAEAAAPPVPSIPSVILTVLFASGLPQ